MNQTDDEYTTMVFKMNAKDFKGNFFRTETPFGRPIAVGMGDLMARVNELEELLEGHGIEYPQMRFF